MAGRMVRVGITTEEIDIAVHNKMISLGAYPSPLNYHEFPKSCCTSVNEVICHGIPDSRPLQNGDIVNLDITAYFQGVHGDLNETYLVGEVDANSKNLVKTTYEAMMLAVEAVKPGAMVRDFGEKISKHVGRQGFSIVRSYCGHGVGALFHSAPNIPHYSKNKAVGVLKAGMIFTIEPMINAGGWKDVTWPDEWTSTTEDGKRSAQFEHTILVTETGYEVLTARTKDSVPLFWETEQTKTKTEKDKSSDAKETKTTAITETTQPAKKKKKKSNTKKEDAAPAETKTTQQQSQSPAIKQTTNGDTTTKEVTDQHQTTGKKKKNKK